MLLYLAHETPIIILQYVGLKTETRDGLFTLTSEFGAYKYYFNTNLL